VKSKAKTPSVRARQDAALLAAAVSDIRNIGGHIELLARSAMVMDLEILFAQPDATPVPNEVLVRARLEIANNGRPSLETIAAVLTALEGYRPPTVDSAARTAADRMRSAWSHERIADLVEREIL